MQRSVSREEIIFLAPFGSIRRKYSEDISCNSPAADAHRGWSVIGATCETERDLVGYHTGAVDCFLNLDKYLQATEKGSPCPEAYKGSASEDRACDMGLGAEVIKDSVDRYDELRATGEDTDFGKASRYPEPSLAELIMRSKRTI